MEELIKKYEVGLRILEEHRFEALDTGNSLKFYFYDGCIDQVKNILHDLERRR